MLNINNQPFHFQHAPISVQSVQYLQLMLFAKEIRMSETVVRHHVICAVSKEYSITHLKSNKGKFTMSRTS